MDAPEIFSLSEKIEVSVIIPHFYNSRRQNIEGLLADIKSQTFKNVEVILVRGVSPQGLAINQGVRQARGEFLVIVDDDSRMGHERVIEYLAALLRENPKVGMAGASVVLPPTGNGFQIMASKQFPRYNMPIVDHMVESDFPGHPCSAFPKDVFIRAGMEREDILRGLDPDLRQRIRKIGYKVVLAPKTWIYHPMPASLPKFIRMFLRNGYGSAYLQCLHPELNYDTDETLDSSTFVPRRSLIYRFLRYPVRLFQSFVKLQWLRLIGYLVYIAGYLLGFVDVCILRHKSGRRIAGG